MSDSSVTDLLQAWTSGNREARDRLISRVYSELRRLAARRLRLERKGHTLQPTALVHEAFLRLVDQQATWHNRAHFFAVAAQQMRRVLVDHARRRRAHKRGDGTRLVTFDDALASVEADLDVLDLDEALRALAALDSRQARIVELRHFGGLDVEEVADVLGISTATVKREWTSARAWLHRRLKT